MLYCCHHFCRHFLSARVILYSVASPIFAAFSFIQMDAIFGPSTAQWSGGYKISSNHKVSHILPLCITFFSFFFFSMAVTNVKVFFPLSRSFGQFLFLDILQTTAYHHFYWFVSLIFVCLPFISLFFFPTFDHASCVIEWTEFSAN